ncbi:MAG: amidohydrolase [Bacteroides sp. SM23_62]|nr:MAG: amidohydrolase [Bacteroides sp. SM23_62]
MQKLFIISLSMLLLSVSGCVNESKSEPETEAGGPETLLLKNFRPESIFNIPVNIVEKARYPVIDMHAHTYARSEAEMDQWVKTMDERGIEKTVILSPIHGLEFDSVFDAYAKYPDRFEVWCGIDFTGYEDPGFPASAIAELERCHENGASGVGELGDKGKGFFFSKPPAWGMHADDPRMGPIWEKCAELGMPVNIHVAEPKWMYEKMDSTNDGLMNAYQWRLDNQPDIVDHQGMIDILERTVKNHPRTTFIACHVANCGYDLGIIARLLDAYPNLHVDIGARFAEICATPRATAAFMEKYQDRIVYGTDMGTSPDMYQITFRLLETADEHIYDDRFGYHWPLHGLNLPEEVLEKIYRLNAMRICTGTD